MRDVVRVVRLFGAHHRPLALGSSIPVEWPLHQAERPGSPRGQSPESVSPAVACCHGGKAHRLTCHPSSAGEERADTDRLTARRVRRSPSPQGSERRDAHRALAPCRRAPAGHRVPGDGQPAAAPAADQGPPVHGAHPVRRPAARALRGARRLQPPGAPARKDVLDPVRLDRRRGPVPVRPRVAAPGRDGQAPARHGHDPVRDVDVQGAGAPRFLGRRRPAAAPAGRALPRPPTAT